MRFLAFAVLAVAAVSGNEIKRICEPGTLTKNGCNDCLCSADGTFQSCTMMACMSDTRLRRETIEKAGVVVEGPKRKNSGIVSNNPLLLRLRRQVSHNRPCEAGKQFKIYCNTCSCGSDGYSVACTRMECPKGVYNEDGSLKNVEAAPNNALLRLKRQLSQNITCEPGKTFKSYCNTCSCGLDGVSIACTLMACDETVYNPDGSLKSPGELSDTALLRQKRQVSHDRPCEAGKQFKVYCNTCACGSDGFSVVCTRMACPKGVYNEDGSLKNVQEAPSDALPRQKRQVSHNRPCEAGKQFKIYCNTCACGSDGFSVACTRMECPKGVYNEDGSLKNVQEAPNNPLLRQKRQVSHNRPCEAGKQFKIYCNTCSCASDGFSVACTRMECPKGVYNEDGSLKNVQEAPNNSLIRQKRQVSHNRPCEAGKKFKIYCNTCACGSDGFSVACTRMECPKGVYNEDGSLKNVQEAPNNSLLRQKRQVSHNRPCEAGKQFKIYCNTCSCGSDGFSVACTRMECPKGVYNEDGSLKNVEAAPNKALLRLKRQLSQNTTCEPGKTFKSYCNTCRCGLDGVSIACTLMACDETVYNQDGSLKNPGELSDTALLRQKRQVSHNRPCEAGKQFKIYCNTCACGSDGFSVVCTRMECPKDVYNEDGSLKNLGEVSNNGLLRQKRQLSRGTTCEPGKAVKYYCNTCTCGNDGVTLSCAIMPCPPGVHNRDGTLKNLGEVPNNTLLRQKRQLSQGTTCEPGKTFKNYCNTCTCGNDGVTMACTIMACPEGLYNQDGTLKSLGEVPNNGLLRQKRQLSQGTTCEPGKTFKNYCNTCTCGNDGVTMACTIMACPEGLYNQDGTLKSLGEGPNNALLRQKRQASEEQSCKPGESFKVGCNTCGCDDDGRTLHCTQLGCPEDYTEEDNSRD